jgi:hypothetical protein
MEYEISIKYKCENPSIICKSIQQDDLENTSCSIEYIPDNNFLKILMKSSDMKNLQKSFNRFSQRFKLAEDTYEFCKIN